MRPDAGVTEKAAGNGFACGGVRRGRATGSAVVDMVMNPVVGALSPAQKPLVGAFGCAPNPLSLKPDGERQSYDDGPDTEERNPGSGHEPKRAGKALDRHDAERGHDDQEWYKIGGISLRNRNGREHR